ncbi:MAG: hypothetical protein ACREXX_15860, partial [Gammaproteobacteria bacterium]
KARAATARVAEGLIASARSEIWRANDYLASSVGRTERRNILKVLGLQNPGGIPVHPGTGVHGRLTPPRPV